MRRRGKQLGCVLLAAALAFPAAAFGQSAGDEQYQDPFAPSEEEANPEPAPAQPAQDPTSPAPAPEPAPAQPAQDPTTPAPAPVSQPSQPAAAAEGAGREPLPYTGADEGLVALAGGVLLASGLALRRRTCRRGGRA
jgi:LPXTG-motif cell wall-anchored protein